MSRLFHPTRPRRLRSHVRLFLLFIITMLIPLSILTVMFLNAYHNIYLAEAERSSSYEMDTLASSIDSQVHMTANYLTVLSMDSEIRRQLLAASSPDLQAETLNTLPSTVVHYSSILPSLFFGRTIIVTPDNMILYGREYVQDSAEYPALYRKLASIPSAWPTTTVWFSDLHLSDINPIDSYIYAVRLVMDDYNSRKLGYVIYRVRASNLVSMYLVSAHESRSIFILDDAGMPMAEIDNLAVRDAMLSRYLPRILLGSDRVIRTDGASLYAVSLTNHWHLASITKPEQMSEQLHTSITLYITALVACTAAALVIAYVSSKRFMVPINLLIDRMRSITGDNLNARVDIHTNDEIQDLADNYNVMLQRIENLVNQVSAEQEQKRVLDIRALQAQINPHFLYNTLASLRYMIYTGQPKDVDAILLSLTKLLKYVLSGGSDIYASLCMELEQLDNYIAIQRYSFEVPLRYEKDIEDGIGSCRMVKLLLQPLVENAIFHGLKMNRVNPKLRIRIHSTGDAQIRILIEDNGIGFDTNSLDTRDNEADFSGNHVGIANIRRRLQLHYGDGYRFRIGSVINEGTTVEIIIPRLTEEDAT